MRFAELSPYLTVFLAGAGYTLLLSACAIALGLVLTILFYVAGAASRWVSPILDVFQELVRMCPPLIVLLWVYYALPGVGIVLPPFAAGAFALALYFAVFGADILRGAAKTIPGALLDTETAVASSRLRLLVSFTLPDLFRRTFPAMNAQVVSTIKNSSLASIIGFPELTYVASLTATEVVRPFEVYTILAVSYIMTILPIILLLRRLERSSLVALEPAAA